MDNDQIFNEITTLEIFPKVLEILIVEYLPDVKICFIDKDNEICFSGKYTRMTINRSLNDCYGDIKTFYTLSGDNRIFKKFRCLSSIKSYKYSGYYIISLNLKTTKLSLENLLPEKIIDTSRIKDRNSEPFIYFHEDEKSLIINHYVFDLIHYPKYILLIRKDIYEIIQTEINHIRECCELY